MECPCELFSIIGESVCQIGLFVIDNSCKIGIAVLFAISFLHLLLRSEKRIQIQIIGKDLERVKTGATISLTGTVQFHHSVKCIKWQKYHNGQFVDINIHKLKYQGTTNNLQNPKIVINDVDQDDEVDYRLEVQRTISTEYSNVQKVQILPSPAKETSSVKINSNQPNNRYFVGEDVIINASINKPYDVQCVTWQRETENECHTINTTLSKFKETKVNKDEFQLIIEECDESDEGTYFLLAGCTDTIEYLISNKIDIDIVKGPPEVILSDLPESLYNECIQIKASIRSFPKYSRVIWFKGEEQIDIDQPKYEGSFHRADFSVLCINNLTKEDEFEYTINITNDFGNINCSSNPLKVVGEKPMVILSNHSPLVTYGNTINLEAKITSCPAPILIEWRKDNKIIKADDQKYIIDTSHACNSTLSIKSVDFDDSGKYTVSVNNALGSTQDEKKIDVKAIDFIFIAGPVVVMPSTKIKFLTIYPKTFNCTNGEWCVTRDNVTTKLDFKASGYSIKTLGSQPITQKIKIECAAGNDGAYQLFIGTSKSNTINVFVDDSGKYITETEGNCLRFFALQAVGKDAMRRTLDSMPEDFEKIWDRFEKYCKQRKGKFLELLPKSTPKSSSDLDFSTMYSLFRNTSNITRPTKGWGQLPGKNDIKPADDIERLRNYRNKICHENSSEMTTKDFNEFVLDFIWAIQRLTGNDEQVIKQICEILNKVCCRGEEMDRMIKDLTKFKESAAKAEDILKELKDDNTTEGEMSNDKQTIYLTGNTEVVDGEKALFIAFIDKNISTSSKVCWQKISSNGEFRTIDINDGKYIGSTTKFPSPELHIHFVRKEDEGTYRIVINTFRKIVQNCIQLKVKNRDWDEVEDSENDNGSKEIGIHEVHHPNIILLHNNTIAMKKDEDIRNGICYTNRSLEIGEKVYVRIAETCARWSSSIDFGFTNTDPARNAEPPMHSLIGISDRKTIQCLPIWPATNNVICMSIDNDATVSCYINDTFQFAEKLTHVLVNDPIWLVIDLYENTKAIEISHKKPKIMFCDSFLMEIY